MSAFAKSLGIALVAVCLAANLGGCGKKTQLVPPDGTTYPRQYPQP